MAKNFKYVITDMDAAAAKKSAYTKAFLQPIIDNGGTALREDIEAHVKGWLEAEKSNTKITVSGVMSYQGHGLRKEGLIQIFDEEGNEILIKARAPKEEAEGGDADAPATTDAVTKAEEELEDEL